MVKPYEKVGWSIMLIMGIIGFVAISLVLDKSGIEEIIVVALSSALMSVGAVELFKSIRSR